ncbi:MAG: helix-turn-helix domain protein [Bacteroidetes bacterium]|jgi:transcriptional regulator with XRE-family HTH domain|nr:helix-turn-helix domain protein [Bacteroidota bacterium]
MKKVEKDAFVKRLGENIAAIRIEKKITQVKLAQLCKKQKQSISRLEAGQINPTAFYLHELAIALKVPVVKLFDF